MLDVHSFSLRRLGTFALFLTFLCACASGQILSSNSTPPTVGMEGRLEVVLREAGLTAKAPERHSPLLLRVAETRPHGTLTRYDLRYVGNVPGTHDLRDYLFTTNGQPATNLPPLPVTIAGVLPTPHSGWLEEQAMRAPSLFGGYRAAVAVIAVLWVALFFVILRVGRKPRPVAPEPERPREPGFAERLRPLVERAAAGTLTADEKAALERMLILHWQQRLALSDVDGEELIARLREHPEAGALLRSLEDWLHRPPGTANVDVEAALAPYRTVGSRRGDEAENAGEQADRLLTSAATKDAGSHRGNEVEKAGETPDRLLTSAATKQTDTPR